MANEVGSLEIGVRIRAVRTYRGMTMVDLADKLEQEKLTVAASTISRIENGGSVAVDFLALIAKALDVSIETFTSGLTVKVAGKSRIKFEEA